MSNFSARGGWWVVGQLLWFVVIGAAVIQSPGLSNEALVVAGSAMLVAGLALSFAAARALGPRLTPYPEPLEDQSLMTRGVYRHARHPIYGGVVLSFLGTALLTGETIVIVLSLGLIPYFWFKSISEERRLTAAYPDYERYRALVPKRLIPWIL